MAVVGIIDVPKAAVERLASGSYRLSVSGPDHIQFISDAAPSLSPNESQFVLNHSANGDLGNLITVTGVREYTVEENDKVSLTIEFRYSGDAVPSDKYIELPPTPTRFIAHQSMLAVFYAFSLDASNMSEDERAELADKVFHTLAGNYQSIIHMGTPYQYVESALVYKVYGYASADAETMERRSRKEYITARGRSKTVIGAWVYYSMHTPHSHRDLSELESLLKLKDNYGEWL